MNRKLLSIVSCFLAISLLTAPKTPLQTEPVSAASNQLNLKIYMCDTMCYQFHGNDGHITAGTYGVPASFNKRLPDVLNYVKGYYRNASIILNPSFSTSNIRDTPASNCAWNSSDPISTIQNGCSCVSDSTCASGNWHHSSIYRFRDDIPTFNPNNECAVYLTAAALCNKSNGNHGRVWGATWKNNMEMVVSDLDHAKHNNTSENNYPYAYAKHVLIHELGHLYDAPDHYAVLPDQYPNCVWGKNHNTYQVVTSNQTCSNCHQIMFNNRNRYQHS